MCKEVGNLGNSFITDPSPILFFTHMKVTDTCMYLIKTYVPQASPQELLKQFHDFKMNKHGFHFQ